MAWPAGRRNARYACGRKNGRKMEISKQKAEKNRADVDSVIASLTGILPDTGKTLEEYREERLKKYGFLKSFCQI